MACFGGLLCFRVSQPPPPGPYRWVEKLRIDQPVNESTGKGVVKQATLYTSGSYSAIDGCHVGKGRRSPACAHPGRPQRDDSRTFLRVTALFAVRSRAPAVDARFVHDDGGGFTGRPLSRQRNRLPTVKAGRRTPPSIGSPRAPS